MNKIYGPYLRKDGRQHLVIVEDNKKYTISYPKWLMENHLKRKLESWETVDHIDNNPLNNDLTNLQILSRADNARKSVVYAEQIQLKCKYCGSLFFKRKAVELYERIIRKKDGPFCSKQCVGKVHN